MSAWIVEKGHIDVLVQGLMQEDIIPATGGRWLADECGALLWEENHRSVNYCYGEDTETPEYTFRGVEAPLDRVALRCAADCYDYQSCEHPGWRVAEARVLVTQLLSKLDRDHVPSYKGDWPWGFTSVEQAVVGSSARVSS